MLGASGAAMHTTPGPFASGPGLVVHVLWFRSWGFAIVMVELLQARGITLAQSMTGRLALPIKLSFAAALLAFGLILAGGGAWSVLATALVLGLAALITPRRHAQQKGRA